MIPRLTVAVTPIHRSKTQAVVLPVFKDTDSLSAAAARLDRCPGNAGTTLRNSSFDGAAGKTLILFPPGWAARTLILTGLGSRSDISLEAYRRAAAAGTKAAREVKAGSVSVVLVLPPGRKPELNTGVDSQTSAIACATAEGGALGLYSFDRYVTRVERKSIAPRSITVLAPDHDDLPEVRNAVRRAQILVHAVWLARDLSNAPGSEIYPATLARRTAAALRGTRTRVRILDRRRISALGMGGVLGVARGSARTPRFIVVEWGRRGRGKTIALLGKGVTFDSGGISIKPSANMAEMRMDMAGAAAVIGTVQACARLGIPHHIVGLIPCVENLPGGRALKPGDILTHMNGMTSEVDNTDAEGRLLLADALCYARRFKPALVIDLATLTGAVVVALGHFATGMLGTSDTAMDRLRASGERTYERVWQLPLFREYERLIQSEVADVKNVGGRWGGAITAAMFLKQFAGDLPWVHLDIAGTAILEESSDYLQKGGSGVGVRLLVDFLRHWNWKGPSA